jgi:hypothetical protein
MDGSLSERAYFRKDFPRGRGADFLANRPQSHPGRGVALVRHHRYFTTFHHLKLNTGRERTRSCDVEPGQY